jgi:predicted nucleic acid-binding protein
VRLFLDTNILFSAAQSPRGGARQLFELAAAGHCNLVTSQHAVLEARRNLTVKSPSSIGEFVSVLASVELVPEAGSGLVAKAGNFGLPGNDAPILASAIASRADLLVTGDRRHFGHLFGEVIGNVHIVTLVEALERVVGP